MAVKIKNYRVRFFVKISLIFITFTVLYSNTIAGQALSIEKYSVHSELLSSTNNKEVSPGLFPLRYWFIMPVSLPAENERFQQSIIKTDPAHAFKHLGIICKWEYRIEQSVQFPVKFRLGEYHYVQKLEGKSLHNY
ncbi:MAG: hypothetical protein RIC19_08280 [Phaeodactylibacter sp.]|uniref:hypothetical protein n=1 Tax=Phaeodactylibacter sp. TaxID=1940289 RepID=UPI0032EFD96E